MPGNIKSRATAQVFGRGFKKGKATARQGRKNSDGRSSDSPEVIANSIFALTLPKRLRIDIDRELPVLICDSKEKMLDDLTKCVNNGLEALGKPALVFSSSDTVSDKLSHLFDVLKKEIVPPGGGFSVSAHQGRNIITVYKDMVFGDFWHELAIKPILDDLKKRGIPLGDLFIDVVRLLINCCAFGTWYGGYMYAYDMHIEDDYGFEEFLHSRVGDLDSVEAEEELIELTDLRNTYISGKAHKMQNRLTRKGPGIKSVQNRLQKCRYKHPIVQWMKDAIRLIAGDFCMTLYDGFDQMEEDDNDLQEVGVRMRDQTTVIWDYDFVHQIACEYIDNDWANFGASPARLYYSIRPDRKLEKIIDWTAGQQWIMDTTILFQNYNDKILGYIKQNK